MMTTAARTARCAVLLALGLYAAAFAAAAELLPNPDIRLLQSNNVTQLAVQPDGGLIVGAYRHESVDGVKLAGASRALVRLDPRGRLDQGWTAPWAQGLRALASDAAGNIYVGADGLDGNPTGFGRLDARTGVLAAGWITLRSASAWAIAIGDGWVYAGGRFTLVDGSSRSLIRISVANGEMDAAWAPSLDHAVQALAIAPGGLLYAAGGGADEQGRPVGGISRITTANGGLDRAWRVQPDNYVTGLAVDAAGDVYAVGYFTAVAGQPRNGLAKFSAATGKLLDWNPAPDGRGDAIAVDANGIYVAGAFTRIGGLPRERLARLSGSSGQADPAWQANLDGLANTVIAGTDGIWIGGDFQNVGAASRLGVARLDPRDASAAATADVAITARVWTIVPDGAGRYLVGGRFARADGRVRNGLLRLRSDLTLDADWAPAIHGWVNAVAVDEAAGQVYAGGAFRAGGGARNLVRIDSASGQADEAWRPDPDGAVSALAVQDGALHVGGAFAAIANQPRRHLVRFLPGQAVPDGTWSPEPDGAVFALALARDGTVFAGGRFSSMGGQPRAGLARLSARGASSAGWVANLGDGWVQRLALHVDGTLYVQGSFHELGGVATGGLARVDATTASVDAQWLPSIITGNALQITGGGEWVVADSNAEGGLIRYATVDGLRDPGWLIRTGGNAYALADGPSGSLLVGGEFASVEEPGITRYGLAAFSDDAIVIDPPPSRSHGRYMPRSLVLKPIRATYPPSGEPAR